MTTHLCHVFPAFATGGPEIRTAFLIDAFQEKFRHTILSINGDTSGRERIRVAREVRCLSVPRPPSPLLYPWVLAQSLRELGPDVVLSYGWGGTDAILAARLCGLGPVIHAEDGFLPDEGAAQKWQRLLVRRLMFRAADCLVCPSRTLVQIARAIWRLPPSRIRYIPNGVDTARFAPVGCEEREALRRQRGFPENAIVVGSVGALRQEKNHGRLLKAFASLIARHPARLVLVGDGPLRGRLEEQAAAAGIADAVLFAGSVPNPVEFYRLLDVFALSSDTEQMPLALLEAMAVGLPVVSTNVGDVQSMVSSANRRWITPLGDDDAYAGALAMLAEDQAARAAIGVANREKCAREFEIGQMLRAYLDLYLCRGRRPAPPPP